MPYVYSKRGLSVRWEDEPYVLKEGETAADVFTAPAFDPLTPPPAPSFETRLTLIEARLEQFLKIAAGITGAVSPR